MFRWLGKNFRTFLWAFVMAVAVWLAAVTASDPDEVRAYPAPIPVEIVGQDPALIITGTYPEQVELTLRAPRSVWEQLTANEQAIHAILDLSGLDAGSHNVDIQIQIGVQPVRIVSVTPASAALVLESLITRTMPVDLTLSGEPAVGYQAGEAILDPAQVVISGAESLVNSVARVRAFINLGGAREDVEQSLSLEPLDEKNQPVTGVTLSPDNVQLTVRISQQGGYRDMAVKVVVNGQVASGYHLTSISVFPPVVTAFSSDPQLVNNLPGVVETAPLDINGISDNISTRLALNLPEGVSVVGEQSVLVQVSVEAIVSSLTISNKPLEIENLTPGLTAEVSPQTVDVILSGPLPLLDMLSLQDVRVVIDVTDLEAGTHQLTPTVEILVSDITVESILPATVEVILSPAGTSTTTPTP